MIVVAISSMAQRNMDTLQVCVRGLADNTSILLCRRMDGALATTAIQLLRTGIPRGPAANATILRVQSEGEDHGVMLCTKV